MTKSSDQPHAASRDTVTSAVGDETVILQLKTGRYFGLDAIGTRIWAMLNEGVGVAEICTRLQVDYNVAPAVIEADVRRLLGELEANQIIDPPDAASD